MVFTPELGKDGLLFSGSADRTIKIWDPWGGSEAQLHSRSDHYCVQTIHGHSGSVTCVQLMSQQHHGLVSSSLDHTIRTWYPADGRGLLLYPWYVPAQTIALASGTWPTSLVVREGASSALFVGDSSGCISLYTAGPSALSILDDNTFTDGPSRAPGVLAAASSPSALSPEIAYAAKFEFALRRKLTHFHTLGVLHLALVADNSLVVSLGYDQKAQVLDAISGALSSTIVGATRFTCCAWDARGHYLLLGDALGQLTIWDVFHDKRVRTMRVFPRETLVVSLSVALSSSSAGHSSSDFVFAGVASCMKQWRIDRDVGYAECSGHSECVTALAVIRDDDDGDGGNGDCSDDYDSDSDCIERDNCADKETTTPHSMDIPSARFVSASLDSTIRCWDVYAMKASFGFEERESEVTSMVPSTLFRKLFTGHESGAVKAWGIHTGQCVKSAVRSKSAVTCVASTYRARSSAPSWSTERTNTFHDRNQR